MSGKPLWTGEQDGPSPKQDEGWEACAVVRELQWLCSGRTSAMARQRALSNGGHKAFLKRSRISPQSRLRE